MSQETRLFVNNIPDNIDENDLRNTFSQHAKVCNIDLKTKIESDNIPKKFAFITLSASSYQVESCIKYFSNEDFNGSKLYVTRARESFLERLQREREQAQRKEEIKNEDIKELPKYNPVMKLSEKLNPRKRNFEKENEFNNKMDSFQMKTPKFDTIVTEKKTSLATNFDKKKEIADIKRLESMKKKRTEFKEKQKIIKTGLVGIDKVHSKKIIFNDEDELTAQHNTNSIQLVPNKGKAVNKQNALFEDDDSDNDLNFEIKKQFEGKKGQKVLELQSRYKSDKRFVLDERFIDDEEEPDEKKNNGEVEKDDEIVTAQEDEKIKQLNILQNVLGVEIKSYSNTESMKDVKKNKPKLGMLRFDPTQPEHAKFLVPVEEKQEVAKKSKKKKLKDKQDNNVEQPEPEVEKVVVSKEQFYKVSDTLKEAIAKPTTFSLRSLFANNEEDEQKEEQEQDTGYIPLEASKETKVKNPLAPGEKNPFMYDSSDSEEEEKKEVKDDSEQIPQPKAVWKETLFFSKFDDRLKDGLIFFANSSPNEGLKERRGLKYLMKKRINNAERKNQMFQKKIGGRKKSMKKHYRTKR